MDFQQKLQQEVDKMNQGNQNRKDVTYPSNTLKHPELRFGKDNKEFTVRILPPKSPDEFFVQPAKEIFLMKSNKNNKELKLNAVIGYDSSPEESSLVSNLLQWQQQERVPNTYNKKANPTKKFYVNAIQVAMDQQGNMIMERDPQGNVMIRLLKLPQSAYQSIVSKISDPMFTPQNAGEFGLIGEGNAYPVRITKPAPGGMSYTVDVFQKDLGPLDQNWRDFSEDLAYQATPSEEYNDEYVEYFINVVNGKEGEQGGQGGGNTSAPTYNNVQQPVPTFNQPQAQQAPQQNFNQAPPMQQQPNFNQAPPAPQQSFNQAPSQNFNQAPQQSFNQPPAQQQQQAPQPSFNQAPAPAQSQPFDSGEGQVFNDNFEANMPEAIREMPPVNAQQTAPAPTEQRAPVAPPSPENTTFKGVDDVLAQMQALKGNLAN